MLEVTPHAFLLITDQPCCLRFGQPQGKKITNYKSMLYHMDPIKYLTMGFHKLCKKIILSISVSSLKVPKRNVYNKLNTKPTRSYFYNSLPPKPKIILFFELGWWGTFLSRLWAGLKTLSPLFHSPHLF